jgi:Bacterial pre-peptidase C-terminal domain/RTX calcium-binding nonapeptide repeat (4 copies)
LHGIGNPRFRNGNTAPPPRPTIGARGPGGAGLLTLTPAGVTVSDNSARKFFQIFIPEAAMPDDFPADTSTTGALVLNTFTTARADQLADQDWFAVELTGGTKYRIDAVGRSTQQGTVFDPHIGGIYDSSGTLLAGTTNFNGGIGRNARVWYVAPSDGTYYVSAGVAPGVGASGETYQIRVADDWDDFAAGIDTTAQVVVDGTPLQAEIDELGDGDWVAVTLEAGTQYQVELIGGSGVYDWRTPFTQSLGDPRLAGIYDESGALIAGTADSGAGTGVTSLFTATASGTYYIAASGETNGDTGTYQVVVKSDELTAGTDTPGIVNVNGAARTSEIFIGGDVDWIAMPLLAGKQYSIRVEGLTLGDSRLVGVYDPDGTLIEGTASSGSGANAEIAFSPTSDGTYFVAVAGETDTDAGTYRVMVSEDDYAASTATTGRAELDGAVTGDLERAGDRDWFAVEFEAGQIYQIDLEGSDTGKGSLLDPFLYGVFDASGAFAGARNDDSGLGLNSRAVFTATASRTYFIAAGSYVDYGPGTYTLSVDRIVDDFTSDINTTGVIAVNGMATGSVDIGRDADWFAVDLVAGTSYRFEVEASAGLRYPRLSGLYDDTGTLLPGTTDIGPYQGTATASFTATTSGTYYVSAAGRYSGYTGDYTVQVIELASISGTDGNDWLGLPASGTTGLFAIRGGTGTDMMSFSGADAGVFVNLLTDVASSGGTAPFSLVMDSIENVTGSSFADVFYGSDRAETFRGLGGRDMFYGSDGGRDIYDGGGGGDTLSYQNSTAGISASLLRGRGWAGDAQDDRISNIENLTGTRYDDFIWGDHGNNKLVGGNGDDVIIGNGGDDYILAGFGTDTIVFNGNQADYTVIRNGFRTEVTDNVGLDGTDIIGHAEILRFADGDLIL